ncbi:Acetylornithine aminotransferase [Indibacter alkaliphilus LW1]|jgi:acetylornithine/N-succinyldiaminopimelate aminotransferase|uniref:Acetylornithine aminotransferase n=1 Tax=Indibacter alkaliphilus (strain CCUG 57479 / KCTC 22604 / LW1) TaxID=1189612 RepID=S2DG51_INDAL|nr:acetylornithine transaminase [Indibacter alkaliphilus]EOZ98052.1 Acetylornithine aminotransferase [Indibacter alkaliphilus LW1]
MENKDLHIKDQQFYLPTFKRIPLTFIKGIGSRLWDVENKEYIDLLAGIAVNNVGHCHPKVVKAIQEQAADLMHISNFFVSPPQVALAELLVNLSGLERVFFTNSGAESVEGAIKIARRYAHSKGRGGKIISMHNSFHGRTLATIATGQPKYQEGFGPMPKGFIQVPFNDFAAIEKEITEDVAAVILEPIQGEGGIRPADPEYLKAVKSLCEKNDIVLIFDEIQSGIARTGEWFAKDIYGIQPDIMTLAKGLGGGMPIGAFMCNEKIASAIQFGDHGTTFGGNPLATAAALATLQVIVEENLIQAAKSKGKWLKEQLSTLKEQTGLIHEVRGEGLMLGVELQIPAAELVQRLLKAGFIANATAGNVLRLVPPLNIPDEDLEKFIEVLRVEIKKLEIEQK